MHTSLSKKLLAGLLSLVMVLSLVAPGTSAQAATKYSLTDKKSVKSGYTFKYELKGVSKGCYVKVTRNVSGEKVVYNKKELTKTTKVNGTGKTEYYVAAEPPVRCGESHHSGQTEPPCY